MMTGRMAVLLILILGGTVAFGQAQSLAEMAKKNKEKNKDKKARVVITDDVLKNKGTQGSSAKPAPSTTGSPEAENQRMKDQRELDQYFFKKLNEYLSNYSKCFKNLEEAFRTGDEERAFNAATCCQHWVDRYDQLAKEANSKGISKGAAEELNRRVAAESRKWEQFKKKYNLR